MNWFYAIAADDVAGCGEDDVAGVDVADEVYAASIAADVDAIVVPITAPTVMSDYWPMLLSPPLPLSCDWDS